MCRTTILCGFFLLSFTWVSTVAADVYLTGEIKIGDNDTQHIEPNNMLQTNRWHGEFEPVNPIHFNLSDDVTLTQIQLQSSLGISGSLYFVIWDKDNVIKVNRRSSSATLGHSEFYDKTLIAGDYKLAVVGQCFKKTGGSWNPDGWSDTCSSGNRSYDDFSFQGITLKTDPTTATDITTSLAFVRRHHIGDTNEGGNGYGGRWYPDSHETNRINYDFTVPKDRSLESVTIYNYRDRERNDNTVKLKLFNRDTTERMNKIDMQVTSSSGDYVWDVNRKLTAGTRYRVVVQATGRGDKDDISWDDIVIKMGDDITPLINHYRIIHPTNALTCESASIIVQACSNDGADGNCELVDTNDEFRLNVGDDVEVLTFTNGFTTVTELAAYLQLP